MKHFRIKYVVYGAGLVFIAILLFSLSVVISSKKALAFSTNTPIQATAPATNSSNINGDSTNSQPWFAVGRGQYDGQASNSKVYVPVGDAADLTIVSGGGVNCGLDITTNSGPPQVAYELSGLQQDETFNGNNLWYDKSTSNIADGNLNCHSLVIHIPAQGNNRQSLHPGHQNYVVYYFTAFMTNICGQINSCNTVKVFTLKLSVTSGSNASPPYVGLSRNVLNGAQVYNDQTVFGIYNVGLAPTSPPQSVTWDYGVQFAPFCDEKPASGASEVGIYDIDYHTFSQQQNASTLYPDYVKQDQGLTALINSDNNRGSSTYNWGLASPGGNSSQKTPNNGGWNSVAGLDHSTTSLFFNYNNDQRYLLEFKDVSYRNVVQIKLPFDQFDSLPSVGNSCGPTYTYSCKNSAIPANLTAGQTISVTYTLKNTSDSSGNPTPWNVSDSPPEQYHRNVTVDGSTTANNFTTIPNNVAPGGTFQETVNETVPAVGSTKVIKYEMWISTKGAMSGSQCVVILSPNSSASGSIATSCTTTSVSLRSTATDTQTSYTAASPSYWTLTAPSGTAPDGTYYWDNAFPAKGTPTGNPPPPPAQSYLDPTFRVWYRVGYERTVTTHNPADEIPYYIQFVDGNGNTVGQYNGPVANSANSSYSTSGGAATASFSGDTYLNYGPNLLPHNAYTAKLYAEVNGSFQKGGPYGNWTFIGQANLQQCLTATISTVCQPGGNTPTVSPGEQFQLTYTITLDNLTRKTFDTGYGYNMLILPTGGLSIIGSTSSGVTINSGPGPGQVQGQWNAVANSQGQYSIQFRNQSNVINNLGPNNWDGTCPDSTGAPQPTVTPYTWPYFQVWNGDAAAGGGFRTPDNQSPTTYPDYVSPQTAPGANKQYYGGIRALSSGPYKSKTDFGAVAMGLIPNPSNEGFYTGPTEPRLYFANTPNVPSGLGGYLNWNSDSLLVDDYYTKTQVDPGNTPITNDLQSDINNNCPADPNNGAQRCQFQANGQVTIGSISLQQNQQITLYVNGNLTINGDINYPASFVPSNRAQVPYFAIIAKGSITLTNNVKHLDGLYVVQPDGTATGGIFSTCDSQCPDQLVINGAVIAQHAELLRAHGSSHNLGGDTNGITNTPAEIINFVPSMIIGAPMFNPQPSTPSTLYSLPPVF